VISTLSSICASSVVPGRHRFDVAAEYRGSAAKANFEGDFLRECGAGLQAVTQGSLIRGRDLCLAMAVAGGWQRRL